jgi:hypothetical protein
MLSGWELLFCFTNLAFGLENLNPRKNIGGLNICNFKNCFNIL